MRVAKWGNSLAVRIPAEVVTKLGIAPDEEVEIKVTGDSSFEVRRDRRRQEAIEAIRRLAVPLPPGYKFNREEIYDRFDRSAMGRELEARHKKEQETR
ncbi:MAG: AbrB/MazE/SpoVT family DNA-binding domain-containing protein [Terracidiphilus sp.]